MRKLSALLVLMLSVGANAVELKPYRGNPLPDFVLEDLNNQQHQLAKYRGKVVLVNFWATWCPPCVEEMPSMQRLRGELDGEPFVILAVNMGESRDIVHEFLENVPVQFAILMDDDGKVVRDWRVFAFPASFIVDLEGKISHFVFGALEWDNPKVVALIKSLLS